MTPSYLAVTFHESEHPRPFAEGVKAALRAGRVPGKLLYRSPAQAQRWLDYHQGCSPSHTDAPLRGLYRELYEAAAGYLAGRGETPPAHLVGLGCGGGQKDGDLLDVLAGSRKGGALLYTPVDASPSLVMEAGLHVRGRRPETLVHPLVADLERAPDLRAWLTGRERGPAWRITTCFGMIPNLDPAAFPRWLRSLLRPGEPLLFSANLSPTGGEGDQARILPQYNNPLARAWYLGALEALGLPPEAFRLDVRSRPLPRGLEGNSGALPDGSAWQVTVTAEPTRDLALHLFGERFEFRPGEPLTLFTSNRFTAAAVRALLEAVGLAILRERIYASGEEGVFLCLGA